MNQIGRKVNASAPMHEVARVSVEVWRNAGSSRDGSPSQQGILLQKECGPNCSQCYERFVEVGIRNISVASEQRSFKCSDDHRPSGNSSPMRLRLKVYHWHTVLSHVGILPWRINAKYTTIEVIDMNVESSTAIGKTAWLSNS